MSGKRSIAFDIESQLIGTWLGGNAKALIGGFQRQDFLFFPQTFEKIRHAYENGTEVSPALAAGEWKIGELAQFMCDAFPSKSEAHAAALRKEIAARRLDAALSKSREGDPYQQIEELIDDLRQIQRPEVQTKKIQDAIFDAVKEMDQAKGQAVLKTGLPKLDAEVTLLKGQLVIIGARPGGGKTAFGAQLAQRFAAKGFKTLILSLEMTNSQIIYRLFARKTNNSLKKMRAGDPEDWDEIYVCMDEISKLPISVNDTARTMADLRGAIIGCQPDAVIVDYVQLLRDSEKHYSRREEVASITRKLKLMAKEFKLLMVGLAQINRGGAEGIPRLEDLKESGSFEEDADVVLLLSRLTKDDALRYEVVGSESEYKKLNSMGQYPELIQIAKNRDGATGAVKAIFYGGKFFFYEPEVLRW